MKTVTTYINSETQTTEHKWGVFIAETSITALMTPPPLKPYITNKSALSHGKQVLTDSGNKPKVDERDVQLVFGLKARSLAQFITRYRSFCEELKNGKIDLTVIIKEGNTYLKETYYLNYNSCRQYSEFNGRLARFVLNLTEPNPQNRKTEYSADIKILPDNIEIL